MNRRSLPHERINKVVNSVIMLFYWKFQIWSLKSHRRSTQKACVNHNNKPNIASRITFRRTLQILLYWLLVAALCQSLQDDSGAQGACY